MATVTASGAHAATTLTRVGAIETPMEGSIGGIAVTVATYAVRAATIPTMADATATLTRLAGLYVPLPVVEVFLLLTRTSLATRIARWWLCGRPRRGRTRRVSVSRSAAPGDRTLPERATAARVVAFAPQCRFFARHNNDELRETSPSIQSCTPQFLPDPARRRSGLGAAAGQQTGPSSNPSSSISWAKHVGRFMGVHALVAEPGPCRPSVDTTPKRFNADKFDYTIAHARIPRSKFVGCSNRFSGLRCGTTCIGSRCHLGEGGQPTGHARAALLSSPYSQSTIRQSLV